ncbi:MAG TPA: hypothetical protein VIV60_10600 [Polyangiaceae bacterium]
MAIADLKSPIESAQLNALATDLGTTAYELRLLLNAGLPAIVLITANEAQANGAVAAIARHRLVAITCNRSQTLSSDDMVTLQDFELRQSELVVNRATQISCPYANLRLLLRAVHRSVRQSAEQVKERKLRPLMALATGGMVMSKKVTKEVTTTTSQHENVLYLFRHGEFHPWLLRERGANYAALGGAMGPSSFENFMTTVARMRQLAPDAGYDERLVNSHPIRGIGDGSNAVDILAYVMAQSR